MSKTENEFVLGETCDFCKRKPFCKDSVMVKGINKLIKEVAPGLRLSCDKYDSTLTTSPIPPVTPIGAFVEKEVYC